MGDQKYTRADVAGRNGQNGAPLWIVVKDVVYDVSAYLQEHPGGEDAIRDEAGKDTTKEFESVGHSPDAKTVLKKYRIGNIVEQKKQGNVKGPAKPSLVPQKKLPSQAGPPDCSATKPRNALPSGLPSHPPAMTSIGVSAAPIDMSVLAPTDPSTVVALSTPASASIGMTMGPAVDISRAPSTLASPGSVPSLVSNVLTAEAVILRASASSSTLAPNVSATGIQITSPILGASASSSKLANMSAAVASISAPTLGATASTPRAQNTQKTGLLGAPGNPPTRTPTNKDAPINSQSVVPPQSSTKSSHGLSSTNSSSATSKSMKSPKVPSISQLISKVFSVGYT